LACSFSSSSAAAVYRQCTHQQHWGQVVPHLESNSSMAAVVDVLKWSSIASHSCSSNFQLNCSSFGAWLQGLAGMHAQYYCQRNTTSHVALKPARSSAASTIPKMTTKSATTTMMTTATGTILWSCYPAHWYRHHQPGWLDNIVSLLTVGLGGQQ
jgi:hypothetical protein